MGKNSLNLTLQLALQQQQQHEQQATWYPHDSVPSSMAMALAAAILLPPSIPSMPTSLAAMGTFGQQNRMPNQSISPIFNTNAAVMGNANNSMMNIMMMNNNITHHQIGVGLHLGVSHHQTNHQNNYHNFSPLLIPSLYPNPISSTSTTITTPHALTINNEGCIGRPMQNTSIQQALPTPKASRLSRIPQVSLGRKSFEHAETHTTLVYQTVLDFFGVGQKKSLKRFCIDAGVEGCYYSIRRYIENNPTLNQLTSTPNNIDGFSSKVSKKAAAIILSMHQGSPSSYEMDIIITQEICIGMVHKAATTALEANPAAVLEMYDVSKGVCRAKQCLDVVPPNKALALRADWKVRHGRWQCPKCSNADSNVHHFETKLKTPQRIVTPISSESDLKKAIKGLHRNHRRGANGQVDLRELIPQSFHKKENLPHADINANKLNRLTEQVAYPMREKKMNVGIAKVPFEHELGAYHINEKCQELGITHGQLTNATADEVAKLPFANTVSEDKHHPFHRLGQHVVQVRYLQQLARNQEETRVETQFVLQDMISAVEFEFAGENALTSQSLVNNANNNSGIGSSTTNSNIIPEGSNGVSGTDAPSLLGTISTLATATTNYETGSDANSNANLVSNTISASELAGTGGNSSDDDNSDSSSVSSTMSNEQSLGEFSDDGMDWESDELYEIVDAAESKSKVQRTYDQVAQDQNKTLAAPTVSKKIHSDLSTMEYLAVHEAMFTDMLMSKGEKFTEGNHKIYMEFLQWLMTYFRDWKLAQLERRKAGLPRKVWEPSFLAPETWRNVRVAVCGFTHFAKYLLVILPDLIPGFTWVPMQIDNQTPIEGTFSIFRASGHDNENMGKAVTGHSSRSLAKATKRNSYDETDLPEMEDKNTESGKRVITKFGRYAKAKVNELIAKRTSTNQQGISRFGDGAIHKSELLRLLGASMQSQMLEGSFLDLLANNKDFCGLIRLCVLDGTRMKWFKSFVTADENEVNVVCQTLLRKLFSLVEDACHGIKPAFEKAYLDYMMSDEFKEFYESKLPEETRGNRQGAIYLLETLKDLFGDWYFDAVVELIGPNFDDVSEAHLDDESFVINVQLMVGGAMPKLREKFGSSMAQLVINSMSFQQFKGDCPAVASTY